MKQQITIGILISGLAGLSWADPVQPERKGQEGREGREEGGRGRGDFFIKMLKDLDENKDGAISFVEFASGEKLGRLTQEQRKGLFDRLDKNHDGRIQRNEVSREEGRGDRRHRPFDPNGDGKVSFDEFKENPRIAGLPLERKQEIFQKMDRNKDGFLDRADGRQGGGPGGPGGRPHPGGMPGFGELDKDKDGSISFDEFRNTGRMKDLDEDQQEDAFEKLDRDGSGTIEKEEIPRGPRPGGPRPDEKPGKDKPAKDKPTV